MIHAEQFLVPLQADGEPVSGKLNRLNHAVGGIGGCSDAWLQIADSLAVRSSR